MNRFLTFVFSSFLLHHTMELQAQEAIFAELANKAVDANNPAPRPPLMAMAVPINDGLPRVYEQWMRIISQMSIFDSQIFLQLQFLHGPLGNSRQLCTCQFQNVTDPAGHSCDKFDVKEKCELVKDCMWIAGMPGGKFVPSCANRFEYYCAAIWPNEPEQLLCSQLNLISADQTPPAGEATAGFFAYNYRYEGHGRPRVQGILATAFDVVAKADISTRFFNFADGGCSVFNSVPDSREDVQTLLTALLNLQGNKLGNERVVRVRADQIPSYLINLHNLMNKFQGFLADIVVLPPVIALDPWWSFTFDAQGIYDENQVSCKVNQVCPLQGSDDELSPGANSNIYFCNSGLGIRRRTCCQIAGPANNPLGLYAWFDNIITCNEADKTNFVSFAQVTKPIPQNLIEEPAVAEEGGIIQELLRLLRFE